jgi:GH18 family chitinase
MWNMKHTVVIYNSESRLLISYDTPEIARKKGEYIKSKELGGGMWWELSASWSRFATVQPV